MKESPYQPPDIDENGNPVYKEDLSYIRRGNEKQIDFEMFRKLLALYNQKNKKGKHLISKSEFARRLGISRATLDRYFKEIHYTNRLEGVFTDDAAVFRAKETPKHRKADDIYKGLGL